MTTVEWRRNEAASALPYPLVRSSGVSVDIPMSYRADMRVPARIYADDELLEGIAGGEAITQLANVATLPGVVDFVYGMPDMHDGYGFPVGGVAAMLLPDGVVSPGGVGFDINCGVRLLSTGLTRDELGDRNTDLTHEISRSTPAGTGRGSRWTLSDDEMDGVLAGGARYVVNKLGYGTGADLDHAESHGGLDEADPSLVSERARTRGRDQLGSIGSGNHFVELQVVDEIVDAAAAKVMGIEAGGITVLIHTGSRGLGHQVCTEFVKLMTARQAAWGFDLPDPQLSCAPASSPEGRQYLAAMSAAANFAWANRQTITHAVRRGIAQLFGARQGDAARVVYDVSHNMAKRERHGHRELCVHRKGATRAFGPGHAELPEEYRTIGQPVFIPGSMGTATWIMTGTSGAETRSFSSACHGAGRRLSRGDAKRLKSGSEVRKELESQGIAVRCPSSSGLAEEAPAAYKDVERVAAVVERAGIARRVARLRPIGVVKG